uniref:Glutathione synthetase n=1 Tax=Photinus pyralis TaxID=7054 RepID=A0A1Y1MFP8_PHOPY
MSQLKALKHHFDSVLPLPINDKQLKEIVRKAKDWALMHGVAMRSKTTFCEDALQFAPFILVPSPFPRKEFQKAIDIQPTLNEMMHWVAHNPDFLRNCLKDTVAVDEFTGNLFNVYEQILTEGTAQKISLGLLRSDYMAHSDAGNRINQVEINTIASSFAGISSQFPSFNRFVLSELGHLDKLKNLPENHALRGLCEGLLEAWKLYGNPNAVILFIVEEVTYNICDQRFHEFELVRLQPQIQIVRCTLTEIATYATLDSNKKLIVDGKEVAVIYFRAGYEPSHYPSQKEWHARVLMEKSLAIKCPSIQYHLAGTKKVQQVLAKSGALEKFLSESWKVDAVKNIFTGLYSLDFDEHGNKAVQMALDSPERFVLKPQREGGGHNVYGEEVREAVLKMKDKKERTAWILMDRINPPVTSGYMIRPGCPDKPDVVDLVSELGIFGVIIGDSEKIICNRQVGHMLRTKISTANEGGVAAGLGALDSPYLIE